MSKAQLVAISETWLKQEIVSSKLYVDGYTLFRSDRLTRGGGVALYVDNRLNAKKLVYDFSTLHVEIDHLWVEVKQNKALIALGIIYKAPTFHHSSLDYLYDFLPDIIQKYDLCLICGDFNINVQNTNAPDVRYLNNLCEAFNLRQLIKDPTRITPESSSTIDLIFTSDCDSICDSGVVSSDPIICDHEATFVSINCDNFKYKPVYRYVRDFKNMDMIQFEEDLSNVDFHPMYYMADINQKLEYFNYKINETFNKHAPLRCIKFRKPQTPWLTYNIKCMIKLKDKAFLKYKTLKTEGSKLYYCELKNMVSAAIKQEKAAYYSYMFNNINKDSKSLWNKINRLKLSNKSAIQIPHDISDVNLINNHFINSVPHYQVSPETIDALAVDNPTMTNDFSLELVSQTDVLKSLHSIKSNAVGVDGITITMLKLCLPYCLNPLTHIINYSIEKGEIPAIWKTALVLPLPKKENPSLSDLRPISVLPAGSKLLEKMIQAQMVKYLNDNDIIPIYQSGFRKGHSCTTALLKITNDIVVGFDNNKCTTMVFLDMSKAFDSINFDLLLAKLSYYNFNIRSINWFKNYLYDRCQMVRLCRDGKYDISEPSEIRSGVPQGSILGPILFSMFSADIGKSIKYCKFHLYADDLSIYMTFDYQEFETANRLINSDLLNIINWTRSNSLSINANKTKAIMFSKNTDHMPNHSLHIDGMGLTWCDEINYLGLNIDKSLNFNSHVNKICQKSYFALKNLYEYRNLLPKSIKIILIESLVLSIPNYMDCVYGPFLTAFNKYRVQKIQNSCMRFACQLNRYDHITPHLRSENILNMCQRRFLHMSCVINTVINTNCPRYLSNLLSRHGDIHDLNTRHRNNLNIPMHRSEAFKSSFSYQAAHIYNMLPVRSSCNSRSFKDKIKKFILDLDLGL